MMTEKEFFDWMRRNHPNKRLTQEMVDASRRCLNATLLNLSKNP